MRSFRFRPFLAWATALLFLLAAAGDADAAKKRRKKARGKRAAVGNYDSEGLPTRRLQINTLRPTAEGLKREKEMVSAIPVIANYAAVKAAIAAKTLIKIEPTTAYGFHAKFGQLVRTAAGESRDDYMYAAPQVKLLLDEVFAPIAAYWTKYFAEVDPEKGRTAKEKKDLAEVKGRVITFALVSMVRDTEYQERLQKINGNATDDSSHTRGGVVVDVLVGETLDGKYMPWQVMKAVRQKLTQLALTDVDGNAVKKETPLEKRMVRIIEEKRRGRPSCWHIVVMPGYIKYVEQTKVAAAPPASTITVTPPDAAAAAAPTTP